MKVKVMPRSRRQEKIPEESREADEQEEHGFGRITFQMQF